MSWGLWKTLLQPDHEEHQNPERTEISRAANYLQVGEFQLLQLAYNAWHGEDLPNRDFDKLFHDYMIHGDVPPWARHYARNINRLADQGQIDQMDSGYHRYDHDYQTTVPNGGAKFLFACGCLVLFLGGGLVIANSSIKEAATVFPPYFEVENLNNVNKPPPPSEELANGNFGRADNLQTGPGP